MFADTDSQAKATRDPVAPARRSKAALAKVARHTLDDGTPVHSFARVIHPMTTSYRPRALTTRGLSLERAFPRHNHLEDYL
jgi:hypothetical protein